MNLRSAEPHDRASIISLLKDSLGESLIPKSETLWKWKHEQNPFGPSYVLLAEEEGQLIGIRAFMQWTWQWNDKTYRTVRAVDTATHPAHQGKGIFRKLTMKQLELCKEDGIHFVFNTPNNQSRPGYLKMGWQAQGRMPLKLQPVQPVTTALRMLLKKKPQPAAPLQSSDWQQAIKAFAGKKPVSLPGIHTPFSADYILWRYATNPLFPYYFLTDNSNYLLIYRPKEHNSYLELRIADFFLFNNAANTQFDAVKQLKTIAKSIGADFITMSGNVHNTFKARIGNMGPIPVRPSGPIVTLRDINVTNEFDQLMQVQNWQYSLGDMELF